MEENVSSDNAMAEAKKIESTPGFLLAGPDGKLLRDVNRPEYDRLERERDKFYKLAAGQSPEEVLESPESIISKVDKATKELEAAGFQGEQLADQIIESDRDITSEAGIQQLKDDIRRDIEVVNELMEGSDIDIDEVLAEPTIAKLEGYKQMRLLAQENYKSLEPLIIKDVQSFGAPSNKVEMMRNFLSTAEAGDPMTSDIANVIIRHIFKAKKERSEE